MNEISIKLISSDGFGKRKVTIGKMLYEYASSCSKNMVIDLGLWITIIRQFNL
jgi:hypothetical protein